MSEALVKQVHTSLIAVIERSYLIDRVTENDNSYVLGSLMLCSLLVLLRGTNTLWMQADKQRRKGT